MTREGEEPTTQHGTLPDPVAAGGATAVAFLLDGDGTVRWSNAPLEAILPESAADELPADPSSLSDRLATVFRKHDGAGAKDQAGSPVERDGELLRLVVGEQDGYYRRYSYPVGVSVGGESGGRLELVQDVTRLKRREQRLSRFAGVISHDLRNPLDVALGRAEMLPEVVDLDPETGAHVDEIYDSLKRMEHLIEEVLDVARHGETAVDLSPVGLGGVAGEAWGTVETRSAELRIASTAEIRAHRSWLMRLFENLFRNAVEHAGPASLVEVGQLDSADGFYVADDGRGIPPDRHDLLFDDGFSTTEDGTGLGLSIVHEIAKVHDWSVGIDGGIDGGARFEFSGVTFADDTWG